jgi:methionine synthase II (cobalamin-independent)
MNMETRSASTRKRKKLLDRGGGIAWGIVPNTEPEVTRETPSSLKDRLEETMASLSREGISFKQLAEGSLLTPSCSLSSLSEEAAEHTLELLVRLSGLMKAKYL